MKPWVLLFPAIVALLSLSANSFAQGEPKSTHPPKTPAELAAWLPGTMWEIHSETHHRNGEGYLLFREDGFITQIDAKGSIVETKIWGVNVNMLVVWGGGNMRIMSFDKTFTSFTDSRYRTSGKRTEDPKVRKMFQEAKAPKFAAPKDTT